MVGGGGTIATQPHWNALFTHLFDWRYSDADERVRAWAMGNARAPFPQASDLPVINEDRMGNPGPVTAPAVVIEPVHGLHSEFMDTKRLLCRILSQVRMQSYVQSLRQFRGGSHKFLRRIIVRARPNG